MPLALSPTNAFSAFLPRLLLYPADWVSLPTDYLVHISTLSLHVKCKFCLIHLLLEKYLASGVTAQQCDKQAFLMS